jgi:ribosome maturation factor RimP
MNTTDIERLVAPVVAARGLEIDRVEILPAGRRRVVRVFLDGDGPGGLGPSLDDIAAATRVISGALDDSPVIGDAPYTLEVSSRGVDRPLTEAKHYRRNCGRLVQVTGAEFDLVGRITGVDDDAVVLEVDGAPLRVPLDGVARAVVQVEFNRTLADEEA